MKKESYNNRYGRIGSMALWIPILLVSAVYIVGMLFNRGGNSNALNGLVHFVLPLVVLFVVHHYLLLDHLYFRGHIRAYIVSAVLLLALFGVVAGYNNDMRRPPVAAGHRHPPAQSDGVHEGSIPVRGDRPPRNPRHGRGPGPSPVTMDLIMALLLAGADLTMSICLKYASDRRHHAELERARLNSELDYLRAQISPHMLMNTLNNIHAMVELNPDEAQKMLMELSRLMRYVLYEGERPKTTLAREEEFICDYISLMSKRYSPRRLTVRLSLDQTDAAAISIPPLLFIVIIENAFKHGISPIGRSRFEISLSRIPGNLLSFVCTNTRWPECDTRESSGGLGLRNLRKRLDLLFGGNYTLSVNKDSDLFTVTLTIPYEKENTDTMSGR